MNSNWQYKQIGDVCTVERGGSPRPIDKFITDDENGINWIKIGDTTDSMYITETAQRIIPEGIKKSRYVQPGDFLLSNSMSFGRPYILKIDGCIHDGWLVLRDNSNYVSAETIEMVDDLQLETEDIISQAMIDDVVFYFQSLPEHLTNNQKVR